MPPQVIPIRPMRAPPRGSRVEDIRAWMDDAYQSMSSMQAVLSSWIDNRQSITPRIRGGSTFVHPWQVAVVSASARTVTIYTGRIWRPAGLKTHTTAAPTADYTFSGSGTVLLYAKLLAADSAITFGEGTTAAFSTLQTNAAVGDIYLPLAIVTITAGSIVGSPVQCWTQDFALGMSVVIDMKYVNTSHQLQKKTNAADFAMITGGQFVQES